MALPWDQICGEDLRNPWPAEIMKVSSFTPPPSPFGSGSGEQQDFQNSFKN